jgi:hypothetical protein
MTGERQFFLNSKDADSDSALPFGGRVTRQDEGSFGKIHLARQGLHLLVAESASVGKNRQSVAFERVRRKDVELHERKTAKFGEHNKLL